MEQSTSMPGDTTNTSGYDHTGSAQSKITLYVVVSIVIIVALCGLAVVCIYMRRKGHLQIRRKSVRNLLLRGFSTVSQRGVLDSAGEFEMVNTASISSDDAGQAVAKGKDTPGSSGGKGDRKSTTPKKPDRRRRTSSSTAKYENVTLDPQAGFVVRKSLSMNADFPYIDNTGTLDPKVTAETNEDDDVFQ